jgi:hypothetical protein
LHRRIGADSDKIPEGGTSTYIVHLALQTRVGGQVNVEIHKSPFLWTDKIFDRFSKELEDKSTLSLRFIYFHDTLSLRFLRILEENCALKKHACMQEDKIKKLATKLIRFRSHL